MTGGFADALDTLSFADALPRELILVEGTGFRRTRPERIHFYVVLKGQAGIRIFGLGRRLEVPTGSFVFIPQGVSHAIETTRPSRTADIPPHPARIGQALRLLKDDPASPWTVGRLAREVGMSRAAFAASFRDALDETPIQFLTELRLRCAEELIRDRAHSLPEIASLAGYKSEYAFTRAFKRRFGRPLGRHRADAHGVHGAL